jgi:pentatricopeptide repeat protein
MDVFTYSTIVKVTRHIYTLISMSSSSHDFIAFAKFIDVFFLFLVEWRLVILDSFTIFFFGQLHGLCINFQVFADVKLWHMALQIKEDMLSAGVAPNTVAWSSLISACANAGLTEKAIRLFEEMLLAGCEPNTQCCNILLHACVEACQYDRAFRLFQSWKGSRVSKTIGGDCISNLSAEHGDKNCSSVPTGISTSNHINFAKKFPFTPTTTTYNILMKACGTDYYRAKALIDEMKVAGLSPNHISWSILIDICGGSGNAEGAIQVIYKIISIYVIFE